MTSSLSKLPTATLRFEYSFALKALLILPKAVGMEGRFAQRVAVKKSCGLVVTIYTLPSSHHNELFRHVSG